MNFEELQLEKRRLLHEIDSLQRRSLEHLTLGGVEVLLNKLKRHREELDSLERGGQ